MPEFRVTRATGISQLNLRGHSYILPVGTTRVAWNHYSPIISCCDDSGLLARCQPRQPPMLAGLPVLQADGVEATLPAMTGLPVLQAVRSGKTCQFLALARKRQKRQALNAKKRAKKQLLKQEKLVAACQSMVGLLSFCENDTVIRGMQLEMS